MRQFFATARTAATRRAGRCKGAVQRMALSGDDALFIPLKFTEISLRSDALDQKLFSSRSI
jgi:hypothetical protein